MELGQFFKSFLEQQRLPLGYEQIARTYFVSLAEKLADQSRATNQPLLVGINGSQGSGKSTLTQFLVSYLNQVLGCQSIGMSIDDFYLTKRQRQRLSHTRHPLLVTRGVPGTHDLKLLTQTISALLNKNPPYTLPVFEKAQDDRAPKEQWPVLTQAVKIVILEGWCVGCPSQTAKELIEPVNSLETNEDVDGSWRSFINTELQKYEKTLFSKFDRLIMLKAPGFHIVQQWRQEQEDKLSATITGDHLSTAVMNANEIERFIAHYQRITEYGFFTIPNIADDIFELNEQRDIISVTSKRRSFSTSIR